MSPFRSRLKSPEEIELEHKYQELKRLNDQLQLHEFAYRQLKSEIRVFEQVYEDILGCRIETLEDLEWQLKGLLGDVAADVMAESGRQEPCFSHFEHTTDLLDDDEPMQDVAELSLKSLYRGVAKAVHPDLASDDEQRCRRQELMALANAAYQAGDRQVLIDLLREWEQTPVSFDSELDIALELIRVIRQIAAAQQNIHAIQRQSEELQQSDIYHFKLRVDDALADGGDLLSEMAAQVDRDIAKVRRRLATLRGEVNSADGSGGFLFETRVVRFPAGQCCGILYTRKTNSVDYRDWQRVGNACGAKEIFRDTSLRLDFKGTDGVDPAFLAELQPDDLQSLFLYSCNDTVLQYLPSLTGLQELFFSETDISDHGLDLLLPLKSLQRISIYHTAITDAGLRKLVLLPSLKWLTCSGTAVTEDGFNQFRSLKPGCKAISFKWRYQE